MLDLRVLVVAEDPLARAGLATLLADVPGLHVVGQVGSAATLDEDVALYRPDVVLWDLGWNPDDAFPALPADSDEAIPIVVLLPEEGALDVVGPGAAQGFLLRDASPEQISAALIAVTQGLIVVDPALTPRMLPAEPAPDEPPAEDLTPRELEVLRLVAEGLSNRAIAARLEISEHTVKFHVNALLRKLNARSRTEAVVRATRLGLILL